mmetsp:Transcript_1949/g.5140  ORF Transcript_1949/g.5140 Transcript_1949/m.5140 type:complete len:224 (-) Transcript_1949:311-982(-)
MRASMNHSAAALRALRISDSLICDSSSDAVMSQRMWSTNASSSSSGTPSDASCAVADESAMTVNRAKSSSMVKYSRETRCGCSALSTARTAEIITSLLSSSTLRSGAMLVARTVRTMKSLREKKPRENECSSLLMLSTSSGRIHAPCGSRASSKSSAIGAALSMRFSFVIECRVVCTSGSTLEVSDKLLENMVDERSACTSCCSFESARGGSALSTEAGLLPG